MKCFNIVQFYILQSKQTKVIFILDFHGMYLKKNIVYKYIKGVLCLRCFLRLWKKTVLAENRVSEGVL